MNDKRTWIYCRVAHPDTWALAAQQRSLERYAERQGLTVVGTTAEHASGLNYSRRGLAEVSAAAENGAIDFLLIKDLCRLGRNIEKTDEYLSWLKRHEVEIICEDGSIPQTSTEIFLELLKSHGMKLNIAR